MKKYVNRDTVLSILFLLICFGLLYVHIEPETRSVPDHIHLSKGKVLEVDNSEVRVNLIVKTGWQHLRCRILSGPARNRIVDVTNQLLGKMELDEVYVPEQDILVQYTLKDGQVESAIARGHYRLTLELYLILAFALILICVAGKTGLNALLSFVFSALMLWKIMLPLFLRGFNPIYAGLGTVALMTGAISFLVGGISRKGLVTFIGAFLGLLLTCVLALVFSKGFHIHGAVRPFAETLLYSGYADLNLTPIFISGIFVAASGAVMDLAMDIAAAMEEIKEKKPDITTLEHMRSGLRVGRSVIGTMTTTLLLAYSGSYITMLMLFIGQGLPMPIILNLNYVAAEVLNTMVGSFGLVTVAPFTALVGGILYRGKR